MKASSKQFFDDLIRKDTFGANLYERIRNALYTYMAELGEIPSQADG